MSATLTESMTLAEFRALPDDPEVDRELLFGELVERPMTKRNRWHAEIEATVTKTLGNWRCPLKQPRGEALLGEAGCDLPVVASGVGIDVAYFSPEVIAEQQPDATYIVGAPVLAVEILSPSDTMEDLDRKIDVYLRAGVKLVWLVHPVRRTLTVYRSDAEPRMFTGNDQVSGEPFLPGLVFTLADLFE